MGDLFEPLGWREALIGGWMVGIFVGVSWTCQHLKNINANLAQIVLLLQEMHKGSDID
jgi:hypothetical protein